VEGRPLAEHVTSGHALLDGTTDLIIERYRPLLRQGAVLIDETDPGEPGKKPLPSRIPDSHRVLPVHLSV
jgi:hypothetical protein